MYPSGATDLLTFSPTVSSPRQGSSLRPSATAAPWQHATATPKAPPLPKRGAERVARWSPAAGQQVIHGDQSRGRVVFITNQHGSLTNMVQYVQLRLKFKMDNRTMKIVHLQSKKCKFSHITWWVSTMNGFQLSQWRATAKSCTATTKMASKNRGSSESANFPPINGIPDAQPWSPQPKVSPLQ